jgi:hypothetical protein
MERRVEGTTEEEDSTVLLIRVAVGVVAVLVLLKAPLLGFGNW